MKWQTQRINKKFYRLLADQYPNGVTNSEANELYWDNCATEATRKSVRARFAMFGRPGQKVHDFDEWVTMNTRNQLCTLAYHGLLDRVAPGVYRWPADNLEGDIFERIDEINKQVGIRKGERAALWIEARSEAQRIRNETGESVLAYEIFQRYLEAGR